MDGTASGWFGSVIGLFFLLPYLGYHLLIDHAANFLECFWCPLSLSLFHFHIYTHTQTHVSICRLFCASKCRCKNQTLSLLVDTWPLPSISLAEFTYSPLPSPHHPRLALPPPLLLQPLPPHPRQSLPSPPPPPSTSSSARP